MIWLKKYLEELLGLPVEISNQRNEFGDYSSNVLLKHRLDKSDVLDKLNNHPLIEFSDVVNGHLNMAIKKDLKIYDGPLNKQLRMNTIHNRLKIEGLIEGEIPKDWWLLVKKVNELNYAMDIYKESFNLDKDIITLFKKLDKGYIYRFQSKEAQGGLYKLLHQSLIALERCHE